MKKNLLLWLAVGSTLLLSGCSSTLTSTYTSRVAPIEDRSIQSSSMMADMEADFSKIVTAKSDPQQTKMDAVLNAQYKCIMENKIDVIVDPIYKVTIAENGSRYVVELTGYAGYYKKAETTNPVEYVKDYSVEDIEKYKLLTDPSFYQYYYNKDSKNQGDVTNYYINGRGGYSVPTSYYEEPIPIKKEKSSSVILPSITPREMSNAIANNDSYKKAKSTRDTGIALTWIGLGVCVGIGVPLYVCAPTDYYGKHNSVWSGSGVALMTAGSVSAFSGMITWGVGSAKMRKIRKSTMALNFGPNSNGVGLGLSF